MGNDQSRIKGNQIDSYNKPSDRGEIELKVPGTNVSERGGESENEIADALELDKTAQMKHEVESNDEDGGNEDKVEDDDNESEDGQSDARIEGGDPGPNQKEEPG